jgi:hypothetical protein
MANRAVRTGVQPPAAPAGEAPAGEAVAHTAPGVLSCKKCKGTGRVIFVEPGRGIRSVGPCECVKA